MNTNLRLKTAQAAEVAGVGYEGFRTWLKRGLLKDTGTLPQFYAADVEAEVADAKRWRWSAFGFTDLCCFRLTKIMLDAGLSWSMACSIASDQKIWQNFHSRKSEIQHVAAFPKSNEYTLYTSQNLAADLASNIVKFDWMTLFNLHEVRESVVLRSRGATLRAISSYTVRNLGIVPTSGANMLSPAERAEWQRITEGLARELAQFADHAEKGEGSYQAFEVILNGLHRQGAFPENAAVSAVALAFAE